MYLETKQYPFSVRTWYLILRQHNHFGILASMRYAWWLAHGNQLMPPGEFDAWLDAEVERHPYAVGITFGVLLAVLAVWIHWVVTR